MKLYNSRTRATEDFAPLQDNEARIYSCGPTVYNHAHIGNLSAYIFADTLRRTLAVSNYRVHHVMNYTDVDDKTIRHSREQFASAKPRDALRQLTDKYIELFLDDMRAIGNDIEAVTFMRATDDDVMQAMQDLITRLHKKGFAYIADDGVYFSIEAYRKSGKTYGQLLELNASNTSEARIQNDEYDKESVHDFALWKKQKAGEPAWEFSLGGIDLTGRPGWHIECSAMSRMGLGQPFDIHTGGIDLIFPHHENEIAQSTALEENPLMAQFFTHNDHILVDGKKMSKSLGNFYTLEDIVKKGFDPLAFRLKVLQSHYRSQVNFTWESLEAAQNLLTRLRAWADLKHQAAAFNAQAGEQYAAELRAILDAVQDDINTAEALSHISALASIGEEQGVDPEKFQHLLNILDRLMGLQLSDRPDITQEQKDLLEDRQAVREQKDWAKSDELRDKLAQQSVGLRDTANGPIWFRQ